jgi:hypothetical protein
MPRSLYFLFFTITLFTAACQPASDSGDPNGPDDSEKFVPYQEKLARQEKALRTSLKVSETTTLQSSDAQPGTFFVTKTEQFNEQGNLTSETSLNAEGKLTKSVQNNWKGDLLQASEVKNEMGQSYKAVYTYNNKDQKLNEVIHRPSGDTLLARSYTYDANGNETEARLEDRQRKRSLRKTMTHDAQGRPTTIREFQDGSLTWEEIYEINGSNWHVTRRKKGGEVMGLFYTEFDAEGKALKIEQMTADSTVRLAIVYNYDAKGNLDQERHYGRGGNELQSIQYSYQENGLLSERVLFTPTVPGGIKTRWEYRLRE